MMFDRSLTQLCIAAVLAGVIWTQPGFGQQAGTGSQPAPAGAVGAVGVKVGVAKAVITPRVSEADRPVWLAGFSPGRRATGVHDDLYARALFLESGKQRLVMAAAGLRGPRAEGTPVPCASLPAGGIMTTSTLTLSVMPETFAICRLDDRAAIPRWALRGSFVSVTRTADELSIVCPQGDVPEGVQCSRGWRCLRVAGPLDLSLTGVLASLTAPLARARISVFAISTFDTDYLLVQEKDLKEALAALSAAGHNARQE